MCGALIGCIDLSDFQQEWQMNLKLNCTSGNDTKTRSILQRILIGALVLASAAIVMKPISKKAAAI